MWTKEERKNYNLQFWSEFKKKMNKINSSENKHINWLHYPTDIKYFYLRLNTKKDYVSISLDIQNKHESIIEIFKEQIFELKNIIDNIMGHEFHCSTNKDSDKLYTLKIEWKKNNLNYLNYDDKNKIYDFFEKTLVNFDIFYQEYKDIFIFLAK